MIKEKGQGQCSNPGKGRSVRSHWGPDGNVRLQTRGCTLGPKEIGLEAHGSLPAPGERYLICPKKTSLETSLHHCPQVHHFPHHSATGPLGKHIYIKRNTKIFIFFFREYTSRTLITTALLYSVTFL